jgi:hypothetical protein
MAPLTLKTIVHAVDRKSLSACESDQAEFVSDRPNKGRKEQQQRYPHENRFRADKDARP